jgi:drug/metabolite transporter (DMT)-like permease
LIIIGFLEATLPCILVPWAQERLPSSIVAILIGTVPFFTTLLDIFLLKRHQLSFRKKSALLLGFAGIIVLMGPDFLYWAHLPSSLTLFFPMIAVLTSAFSFALSMILIQERLSTYLSEVGPIESTRGILLGALVTTLPLMWVTEKSYCSPWENVFSQLYPLMALLALGIFCGGLAYTLFVILINRAGASFASTCNYLVPLIGTALGVLVHGEKISFALLSSLLLILSSLWLSSDRGFRA